MATFENVTIIPVNSKQRSREMGWNAYDGKRVILDAPFVGATANTFDVCKWIHVGVAGNVVFEQIDGNIGVILDAEVGWHQISARRILTSGTPNDNVPGAVTTTATSITYHGGT